MAKDDDEMFKLDPNGGPDKITRAMYGPKAHRGGRQFKTPGAPEPRRDKIHRIGGWVLIALIILTAVVRAFRG